MDIAAEVPAKSLPVNWRGWGAEFASEAQEKSNMQVSTARSGRLALGWQLCPRTYLGQIARDRESRQPNQ